MTQLIIGLLLFLGVHSISIFAPAARDRWAAALGGNAWRGLYSLAALAGFVLLIHGYGVARASPAIIYVAPAGMRHVTLLLMLPVFPLLLAAQVPGRIKSALGHPMLAAVMLWSTAHLLVNGNLADLLLFGGFLLWAVADRWSFRHRVARPMKMAPAGRWNDLIVTVAGLVLYAATLLWLHGWVIGVPLLR
jgi:uncharacterized membrane protein